MYRQNILSLSFHLSIITTMTPHTHIITEVVENLSTSDPLNPSNYHGNDGCQMPSIEKLSEIIDLCRKLLFPGYFGLSGLNGLTMRYHLVQRPNGYTFCSAIKFFPFSISTNPKEAAITKKSCMRKQENMLRLSSRNSPNCVVSSQPTSLPPTMATLPPKVTEKSSIVTPPYAP